MIEPIADGYLEVSQTIPGSGHLSSNRYYFKHMRSWTKHDHGFGIIIRIKPEAVADPDLPYKYNFVCIPWSNIHQVKVVCNSPEITAQLIEWEKNNES